MPRQTSKQTSADSRDKVAQETASLLYFGLEKEFKQAKLHAAENIGVNVLPSNLEVALKLDQLAEETEGPTRRTRLVQMRTDALEIMRLLETFCPLLIGSVWRGTIRRGSDIDIEAYHDEPEEIVALLKVHGLKITAAEWISVTEHGKTDASFHIHAESLSKYPVEVVVRGVEAAGQKRRCDTFGDEIRGLKVKELEKLLKENEAQRFLP